MTYPIRSQKVQDRLHARIRPPTIINCTCAAFVSFLLAFVVTSLVVAERLPLRTYTVADGLGHNTINKIVRDSRGFLWFCTSEGLSRFDGYSFTNYDTNDGLPHRVVTDFLQTRNGELWVGTNGGLVHFNPRGVPNEKSRNASDVNQRFTVILPDSNDRNAKAISVLLEGRDGTIWCGTLHGLYRLDSTGGRFTLQPVELKLTTQTTEQSFILDLLEDSHGTLWVAAPSGLYRRWADGSVARYTPHDGLPSQYLQDLFEDSRGRIWAASRDAGFFQFVADAGHTPPSIAHSFQKWDGLTTWVNQIFETSDHRFWAATNSGLVEFFPDSSKFHTYSTKNGLAYFEITALNEDMSGNLWMGSYAGAMKLARDGFVTFGEQDGLAAVNGIFEDRKNGPCFRGYVFGGERSLSEGAKVDLIRPEYGCFDGQRFKWFIPSVPRSGNFGWVGEGVSLRARNGEWWLGTGEGLYRFPATDDFTQIKTAQPIAVYQTKTNISHHEEVFRIFEDSRGDVWISTIAAPNGLARWERTAETLRDIAESPALPSPAADLARSFGEDAAGNVWIGFSTGVARYHDGQFSFFNAKDGLPPGSIQTIQSDRRGRLWLASSSSGLIRVDDPRLDRPTFTPVQGLSSNSAGVITEDATGQIYVGTGRGLDRLDPETGRVDHFTSADGLAGGDLLAAYTDRNGALWFGTQKGLSRFLPRAEKKSIEAPPILITGLGIAGESRTVSALGEIELNVPSLPPDRNQVQIDFVGLSFAPGEILHYQFRLEGADQDWGAPTTQRTITYAGLSPGPYKFLVRAVTADGTVSSAPAVITFTILPHVWQRWWFTAIIALLLALIAYSLYRYRVGRLVEIERVRTRIAADLHDDIGSSLAQISVLSEVLRKQLGPQVEPASKNLSLINRVSHEALDSMSDIVWAINPTQDHLGDLVRRMRRIASEVIPARNIEFTFNAPQTGLDLRLGANIRRELFLMFKEAINNLVRHSACKKAYIDLKIEGDWLTLIVTDNGKGFDLAQTTEGNGLVSLNRRAVSLGGQTIVSSEPGSQTTVTIKVPYRERQFLRRRKGRV